MEEVILQAQTRNQSGKDQVKRLRRQGVVPAVVYGLDKGTQSIMVERSDLLKLVHQHHVETALISLKVKGEDKKVKEYDCLIKELQYDSVKGDIIHVDFNRISLTKAIKVNIPVVAKGESAGVKQDGGALEHILWEIEAECLPKNIPEQLEVDVTNLKINDAIHVKDILAPLGVKILSDPESVVLSVVPPVKEEIPVPEEAEVQTEPEVIKEKKEEPGEGQEEEGPKEKPKQKEEKKEAKEKGKE